MGSGCECRENERPCACNSNRVTDKRSSSNEPFKPLLAILNPRRISEFERTVKQLPIDRCRIQGFTEKEIELGAWDEVLAGATQRGYTHISLISDDLIVTPRALANVLDHARLNPDRVTSAWCNVDETKPLSTVALTPLKDKEPTALSYNFAPWWKVVTGDDVQRSYFTGFTLTTLTLKMWKKFPYLTYGEGWAADYHMSRRLHSKAIIIDTIRDAFCHHLKTDRGKPEMIKERQVRFSKRSPRGVVFEEV